jgi:dienelactone hydrolase
MNFMSKRNVSLIEYFNRKASRVNPKYRFADKNSKDFNGWKSALLSELKMLLCTMPEPVPLNPEIIWETKKDGLIQQKILLDLEEDMSVSALVYRPETAKEQQLPAILCNHGHGEFGKDSVMGIRSNSESQRAVEIESMNYDYGLQMAKHGYVTMAIDWRGFGERADGGNPYPNRDKCNVHFIRGSLMGQNLLALNIFDAIRCVDYLCEQKFVDSQRIGAMGLSFGGTMTTWISLLDDRIKAADIICYSCCFKNFAIEDGNFCGSQYLPGLFRLCDVPDLQGLIAPKPLLAEYGLFDTCFAVEDAMECSQKVNEIYQAAGVPENYIVDVFEGGHQFSGNKAFAFFDQHLKGKR